MNRFAFVIVTCWLLFVVIHELGDYSSAAIHLELILQAPSVQQILGYDELGRSVLRRLLEGASVSFYIAVSVVSLSFLIGTGIGLLAAWYGGLVDKIITMLIDIFMAFPGLLLAIALAGVLGPGIMNVVIALVMTGWVSFARLSRAQAMSIKAREHVLAATAMGLGTVQLNIKHILPLVLAPLLVQLSFEMAGAVLAEATLSFLGLGVQAPHASWGQMIRAGVRYMLVAPHLVLAPGICLFLVILAMNILGDALSQRLDNLSRIKHTTGKTA